MNCIILGSELGGSWTSKLMDKMLASLPPWEPDDLLFKGHFLHRLPADTRDQVVVQMDAMPSRELAVFVDNLWFARNVKTTAATVAAVPTELLEHEESLVVAIKQLLAEDRQTCKKSVTGNGWHGNKSVTATREVARRRLLIADLESSMHKVIWSSEGCWKLCCSMWKHKHFG